ncbi:MAG: UDP-glucose 4-epimerase GalE [Proteobacteria bacterium]|nr:UDP-glucose 4-epimerase GalE [Pseudomonadota bacterium]MBU4074261.1 UDP-glucose 4-epimerase GalE [Pseudomonadota bacterium]
MQDLTPKSILVTGGAGFIGSHTAVALTEAGYTPVIVDNLANSDASVLDRIETITGRRPAFHQEDLRNEAALTAIFRAHPIDAVIHFAGLKAVGESVAQPLRYYDNNLNATLVLCRVMAQQNVKTLIFSSSATVYGDPPSVPIREDFPLAPTNPYGRSKLMIEQILGDLLAADPAWKIALLRYFNPVGAHESGLIGETPRGIPNNLMPLVSRVAAGTLEWLNIFGNDYPTPDGTGVRDYIHVMDLAEGHVAALKTLESMNAPESELEDALAGKPVPLIVNLGAGRGYSVLEVVRAFEKAAGRKIPYRIAGRRPGDIAASYADPSLARRLLNWRTTRDLDAMCADAWRFVGSSLLGSA